MQTTYNFRIEKYDYNCPDYCEGTFLDERNGIRCNRPTLDMECYLNYIQYLNLNRDKWTNYGYLDLGMMPVAMGPSFMQRPLVSTMSEVMRQSFIKTYSLPPVSLLYQKCKLPANDLWVFRADVAPLLGVPEDKVTLELLIKQLMEKGV